MLTVLVCGSRSWSDGQAVHDRLARLPERATIVHGGARGADQHATLAAAALGIPVDVVPADWARGPFTRDGRNLAGFTRNMEMLDRRPDLVLAFWDGKSGGTLSTIEGARRRGIPVEIIEEAA